MQTRNTHCRSFSMPDFGHIVGKVTHGFFHVLQVETPACESEIGPACFSTNVPARFLHVDIWHLNLIFPQSIFEMRNVLQGTQDWDIKSLWSSKQRIVHPWMERQQHLHDLVRAHTKAQWRCHLPTWKTLCMIRIIHSFDDLPEINDASAALLSQKHNYVVFPQDKMKKVFQTDIYCKGLQLSNDCWRTACIYGAYFFCCQPIPKVGNAGSKLVHNNAAYSSLAVKFKTCIWIDMHNRHRPLTNTPRLPMRNAVSQHRQHKGQFLCPPPHKHMTPHTLKECGHRQCSLSRKFDSLQKEVDHEEWQAHLSQNAHALASHQ